MKTMFEAGGKEEILARIDTLRPDSQHQWGKMHVAQMMGHCCETLLVAKGDVEIPQTLLGKLIGRFLKANYVGEAPLRKNSPTDKRFVIIDERDFAKEKSRLIRLVNAFSDGGEPNCTKHPHSFFGPMTAKEWGITTYKHLDHHLQQFGA